MNSRQPRPSDPRRATAGTPTSPAPSEASQLGSDPTAERLAYSVDEAARLTGLSRDLLYDEMRRGNLSYTRAVGDPTGNGIDRPAARGCSWGISPDLSGGS